jgi:hypothetical protein
MVQEVYAVELTILNMTAWMGSAEQFSKLVEKRNPHLIGLLSNTTVANLTGKRTLSVSGAAAHLFK